MPAVHYREPPPDTERPEVPIGGIKMVQDLLADDQLRPVLEAMEDQVDAFVSLVREYDSIDDPSVAADDEVLNWCFAEAEANLRAFTWCWAGGFYPTAFTTLRAALEVGLAGLYFCLEDDRIHTAHPEQAGPDGANEEWLARIREAYANSEFRRWEDGEKNTPRMKKLLKVLARQPGVAEQRDTTGYDLPAEIRKLYGYLCDFTHGKPMTTTADRADADEEPPLYSPSNHTTLGVHPPCFQREYFHTAEEVASVVMQGLAAAWVAVYPQLADTEARREFESTLGGRVFADGWRFPLGTDRSGP